MGNESTGAPGDPHGANRYAARSMAIDPRTPVVVGVGQVATPPDAGLDPAARPEPLELMTAALLAAAEDCDGVPAGGEAPAGRALIRRADSIRVVASLSWPTVNPALLVAARLGFDEGDEPGELMVSSIGGNNPQALMHQACLAISRGELDVVLTTGAEALYARALARRDPDRPWLEWASQPEGTPPATVFGDERPGATELEMQRGVVLPVHAYPLFENALRAANGWSLDEHTARIGALWSRFSEVAAGNPHAWIRTARTPNEIVDALARQPDGVVPLSEAVHGQHAGRPRCGLHRVLGRGGPCRRRARGALGLPPRRRGRQRPLVHLRAPRTAPLPCHPVRRCGGTRAGWAGDRRRRVRRSLLVLPRRGADGGR